MLTRHEVGHSVAVKPDQQRGYRGRGRPGPSQRRCRILTVGSEPASLLEQEVQDATVQGHQDQSEGIAEGPLQFGHRVEVHAVDGSDHLRSERMSGVYRRTRTVLVGETPAVVTRVGVVVAMVIVRNFHTPSRPDGTLIL